jgi:glycosyltransferase involved in cell wall biosynthesis
LGKKSNVTNLVTKDLVYEYTKMVARHAYNFANGRINPTIKAKYLKFSLERDIDIGINRTVMGSSIPGGVIFINIDSLKEVNSCRMRNGLGGLDEEKALGLIVGVVFHELSHCEQNIKLLTQSKKDKTTPEIFFEKADEVWIPLPAVEETLREYGYKGHVEVVENGNDFYTPVEQIERMRSQMREELGLTRDETMLLFVGQHTWEKNIAFILDSLALIKDKPYHLFMVGTGYAVREIRHRVAQLGLANHVTLLGNIHDRERLKRIYAAADLFIFPSLYDTCGLVVREAAAMHTPSLMLGGSTAATAITDGVDGFVSAGSADAYARLIVSLMERPETIQKVGNKASKTISRSWESVMEEVILRYRDIQESYKLKHGK